jgi:hypothetical protein
MLRYLI